MATKRKLTRAFKWPGAPIVRIPAAGSLSDILSHCMQIQDLEIHKMRYCLHGEGGKKL